MKECQNGLRNKIFVQQKQTASMQLACAEHLQTGFSRSIRRPRNGLPLPIDLRHQSAASSVSNRSKWRPMIQTKAARDGSARVWLIILTISHHDESDTCAERRMCSTHESGSSTIKAATMFRREYRQKAPVVVGGCFGMISPSRISTVDHLSRLILISQPANANNKPTDNRQGVSRRPV